MLKIKNGILFLDKDIVNVERKCLYCFMGAQGKYGYISDIRPKIFTMNNISDAFVKNTGDGHFNAIVYGVKQYSNGITEIISHKDIEKGHNCKTELYNRILLSSRFFPLSGGVGP